MNDNERNIECEQIHEGKGVWVMADGEAERHLYCNNAMEF